MTTTAATCMLPSQELTYDPEVQSTERWVELWSLLL